MKNKLKKYFTGDPKRGPWHNGSSKYAPDYILCIQQAEANGRACGAHLCANIGDAISNKNLMLSWQAIGHTVCSDLIAPKFEL